MKAAWKGVLGVAFITFLLGFGLAWKLVVENKNGKIEFLESLEKEKQAKIEDLRKDNETLSQENLRLKSALAEFTMPLKKRTTILVSQLNEFLQKHSNEKDLMIWYNDYGNRFQNRVSRIVSDLDEAGQHSDVLSTAIDIIMINDSSPTNIQVISKELQKLATSLKEDTGSR